MTRKLAYWFGSLFLIALLGGCGGGGSSSGATASDTTQPTVSATTPAGNTGGVAMESAIKVTFSEAMDPATIDATTFAVAGVTGTVTYDAASRTATFWPTALASNTTYTATITTGAKDLAGNSMAANYSWSFITAADNTPPKVIATTPANNATGFVINSAVTTTFSEAMNPATVTTATFTVAGVTGAVSYDATSKTAIFKPASNLTPSTTYTATITTGAKDLAGNSMAAGYTWDFTTSSGPAPDTAPPVVSSTIPVPNATGIAINSGVLVNFSEAMDPGTVTTATFTVAGVTGTVSIDAANKTAIFRPTGNLVPNTTYTATIKANVKDLAGNVMGADHTWNFTTGSTPDITPPTIISVNPQGGATNVPVNTTLSLTFSEPVVPFAAGTIDSRPVPVEFTDGNTKITMTPTTNLASGSVYTFAFADADLAGNRVTLTWKFTTQ